VLPTDRRTIASKTAAYPSLLPHDPSAVVDLTPDRTEHAVDPHAYKPETRNEIEMAAHNRKPTASVSVPDYAQTDFVPIGLPSKLQCKELQV
jgi:hypothetical protein